MKITLDIKTLIAIGALIATLGGFYYSTQHRLNNLEDQIDSITQQIDVQAGQMKQIQKQLRKRSK